MLPEVLSQPLSASALSVFFFFPLGGSLVVQAGEAAGESLRGGREEGEGVAGRGSGRQRAGGMERAAGGRRAGGATSGGPREEEEVGVVRCRWPGAGSKWQSKHGAANERRAPRASVCIARLSTGALVGGGLPS